MEPGKVISELGRNRYIFRELLQGTEEAEYQWKPEPGKWNLLEILCHLYDEEIEDFRLRTRQVLEDPSKPLPPFDPLKWVEERNYRDQNFDETLDKFLLQRAKSIGWMHGLKNPKWENCYQHPKLGPVSAKLFLDNWLAHDLLHIRQIIRLKYFYLSSHTKEPLNYAGDW